MYRTGFGKVAVSRHQQGGGTTVTLEISRDAAGQYGITPQMVNDTLYSAFGQRVAAQYFTQTNYYNVA